jgi:tetratricopeptide (TPR) repeat protein
MSDSLRTGDSRAIDVASDADRDAKIEQLLVAGLDHYVAARYEQAINIWTRALFFDRGHPRARAYIDRARSALAERQRESEELLQRGLAAFRLGQRDEARRLLQAAIEGGAPTDEAQTFLDRLHHEHDAIASARIGDDLRGASIASLGSSVRSTVPAPRGWRPRSNLRLMFLVGSLLTAVLGVAVIAIREGIGLPPIASLREAPVNSPAVPAPRDIGLPLPRRGEMALDRARSLAASGRLHDALSALDAIRPTDPQKAEADRVRADIQHRLLGLATSGTPSANADR